MTQARHCAWCDARRLLEAVRLAREHRLLGHPYQHGIHVVVGAWGVLGVDDHVAPAHVDLVIQDQGDRHRRKGAVEVAILAHDRADAAPASGREHGDLVALLNDPRGDRPRVTAEGRVWAQHELHRQPEVGQIAIGGDLHVLQVLHQGRAGVPRRGVAPVDDVVPAQRRDGNALRIQNSQLSREGRVSVANIVEDLPREVHEVHLVDRDHHVLDAEQGRDVAVALGLDSDAMARIDQDNREVAGGGARRHVARVLLVSRRVGDDELAIGRGKVAVGDIDGDALLALGAQPVHQQRQVDLVPRRPHGLAVAGGGCELILIQELGVVEEPAD